MNNYRYCFHDESRNIIAIIRQSITISQIFSLVKGVLLA